MDANYPVHQRVFHKAWTAYPACWKPTVNTAQSPVCYAEKDEEVTCPECKERAEAPKICPSEIIADKIINHPDCGRDELINLIDKSLKEMYLI